MISQQNIVLTCVDPLATGSATFYVHNQKVVSNQFGIFITYLHKVSEEAKPEDRGWTWRLARSTDNGQTFRTIWEETNLRNSKAPPLESDAAGNLYLARMARLDGVVLLYRFSADQFSGGELQPSVTELPNGYSGKWTMLLDEKRDRLYIVVHHGKFFALNLRGELLFSTTVVRRTHYEQSGQFTEMQYPYLTVDENGTLFLAWTSEIYPQKIYRSIHCMATDDCGITWRTLERKPLALPVIADEAGPADLISRADELEVHCFLNSFMAKDGKLHFVYWSEAYTSNQRFLRYDVASGKKELDSQPLRAGSDDCLELDSGMLASDTSTPGSPLHYVSTVEDRKRLVYVRSDDNGESWSERAVSKETFEHLTYGIGGSRRPTENGDIIGTLTDVRPWTKTYFEPGSGAVYFFRIECVHK